MTDALERTADALSDDESWQRFRSVEAGVPEMAYQTDTDGIIHWVSASAVDLLGWLPEDLVGTPARDLVHPFDLERVNGIRASLYSQGRDFDAIPCMFRKADDTYRSVTVRARPIVDLNGAVIGSIVRLADTHDRDSMLRALTTMSQANRVLVRATDETTLLQEMCETIVTAGRYRFAWYGRPLDDPEQRVLPIAQAGHSDGYLDEVRISWGDNEHGRGPTGMSLRLQETRIANDPETDPTFSPWIEPATRRGFRSSISLPVLVDGELDGALIVYASEPRAFNLLAQDLLEDLAADLGYGIHRLRTVCERDQAVVQLTESEKRFRLLAENASDVILLSTADMTLTWVSPSAEQAFGYPVEELLGRNAGFLIHPDDVADVVQEVRRTDATYTDLHVRHRLVRADQTTFWVDVAAGHIDDDGTGHPGRVVSIRDVDAQMRAEQELSARELRYRLLAENASDVVMVGHRDPATKQLSVSWVSPSIRSSFGLDPVDIIGHEAREHIHPDDLSALMDAVDASDSSGELARVRYRWKHGDGSYRWVEASGRAIEDDGGGRPARIVAMRDVDAEVAAERELQAREAQYRLLAENASDVIVLLDSSLAISWVSPSVTQVLGFAPEDLIGHTSDFVIHPDDAPAIRDSVAESETTGRSLVVRYRMRTADDSYRWVESIGRSVVDEATGERHRIIAIRDVEEQVAARQQLEHALGHDQLTGLPTRPTMISRIADMRSELPRFHVVGVLCIGVDGLSEVNEALTHSAGDLLLTTVAARIIQAAPDVDYVGRGSGNELVVILPGLRTGADASGVADAIRLAAQGGVVINGQRLSPTISVGIATGGKDVDAEQLLRDASLALRKAKDNGRDRCEFADPGLAIEAQHRLSLDAQIREGLEAGAFVPWFQPIVSLDTQKVVGYEALVRWIKEGGESQPLSFLNVAERSSLIQEIDLAILRQSVEALADLPSSLFVSINVSTATLGRAPYADEVVQALTRHSVDPSRLHIEVTETMLLDPTDAVIECIGRLAALGVRWYIDDFGTGYASITSLRDLSMSGIKLDRSFTFGISSQDSTSMQLAQALVGLANGLHLDTVAEGVETQAQADYLRGLGWRHGQGWLFGKAAPLPTP